MIYFILNRSFSKVVKQFSLFVFLRDLEPLWLKNYATKSQRHKNFTKKYFNVLYCFLQKKRPFLSALCIYFKIKNCVL